MLFYLTKRIVNLILIFSGKKKEVFSEKDDPFSIESSPAKPEIAELAKSIVIPDKKSTPLNDEFEQIKFKIKIINIA